LDARYWIPDARYRIPDKYQITFTKSSLYSPKSNLLFTSHYPAINQRSLPFADGGINLEIRCKYFTPVF
ncbi:MAG: hypothetical protein ACE5GL_08590, partial [Calditrichia bacterium]